MPWHNRRLAQSVLTEAAKGSLETELLQLIVAILTLERDALLSSPAQMSPFSVCVT